jgi:hypothetical protein
LNDLANKVIHNTVGLLETATGLQKRPCKKDYMEITLVSPLTSGESNVPVMRHSAIACNPCQTTDVAFSVVERYRVARKDLWHMSV